MSAVASAHHRNAACIQVWLHGDPIEQRVDILISALTQKSVIELCERLAVPRRAEHVRQEDRDSEFLQQIIVGIEKPRTRLSLRPAVNLDQHWPLSRELRRWPVQVSGNVPAVKRFPPYRLGVVKSRGIHCRFARCPAFDFSRGYIE